MTSVSATACASCNAASVKEACELEERRVRRDVDCRDVEVRGSRDVRIELDVRDAWSECLYAADDFRIGFKGADELKLCRCVLMVPIVPLLYRKEAECG